MKQKRNQLLDVAKAVAIIFVVYGHALQQCSGLENHVALDLWVERFLISFHMPLFMLISGYLFYFSINKHTEREIVMGRFLMMAPPIITMTVLHYLRANITHFDSDMFFADFSNTLFNTLWFFWAMLVITVLVCFVHRWLRDSWWGYMVIIGATLLLPDVYPLRAYISLLPVFVIAYLFAKYSAYTIRGGKMLMLTLSH